MKTCPTCKRTIEEISRNSFETATGKTIVFYEYSDGTFNYIVAGPKHMICPPDKEANLSE